MAEPVKNVLTLYMKQFWKSTERFLDTSLFKHTRAKNRSLSQIWTVCWFNIFRISIIYPGLTVKFNLLVLKSVVAVLKSKCIFFSHSRYHIVSFSHSTVTKNLYVQIICFDLTVQIELIKYREKTGNIFTHHGEISTENKTTEYLAARNLNGASSTVILVIVGNRDLWQNQWSWLCYIQLGFSTWERPWTCNLVHVHHIWL